MIIRATRALKWVYSVVLISALLPIGLAGSGWVAMARGGAGFAAGLPLIGPILLLILCAYRLYSIVKMPGALDAFDPIGFGRILRKLGVFGLYFGAATFALNLVAGPMMKLLMTVHTDSGAEYFVAGLFLALLKDVGLFGLVAFELSRIVGFEMQLRNSTK